MLILDTCALIFDALDPARLGKQAAIEIDAADRSGHLACCDISLWEIAMLMGKGRLDPGTDAREFIRLLLTARTIAVLPITPEIAVLSAGTDFCPHGDPADRIIAASTIIHQGRLATADRQLATVAGLRIVWQ